MPRCLIVSICLICFFAGDLSADASPKDKIPLCLALHDTREALRLLDQVLQAPDATDNPEIVSLLFDYLIDSGDIEGMRALFEKIQTKSSLLLSRHTVEHIAWATIESAAQSYHPRMRAEASLAAAESQDVRGMRILKRLMADSHQGIQLMALQLAASYPDAPIQQQAEAILQQADPEAKLAAAQLLASQKAAEAEEKISSLLVDETLSEQDRIEAALLVASLTDSIDMTWLKCTVSDSRPAIRALAAAAVCSAPTCEGVSCLIPLLSDPSTSVKKCAFQTLGMWQALVPDSSASLIAAWKRHLNSASFDLSSVAAWALLISSDEQARREALMWFDTAITTMSKEKALLATSRLILSGEAGLPLATNLLAKTDDPFIQMNLACYLLLHRAEAAAASSILRSALSATPTLLEERTDGSFSWLRASHILHHPAIPRLPESQDLFLRLQLLALRCYAEQRIPQEEVEKMLTDRGWGISAAAATFLFQEFGRSLDEILTPLLTHETETVRIQAALLLTIISQSQQAATTLAEQYEKASREGKEAIILGFGTLPASRTQPYLIPLLFDASPILRTRAAGALVSSMYR